MDLQRFGGNMCLLKLSSRFTNATIFESCNPNVIMKIFIKYWIILFHVLTAVFSHNGGWTLTSIQRSSMIFAETSTCWGTLTQYLLKEDTNHDWAIIATKVLEYYQWFYRHQIVSEQNMNLSLINNNKPLLDLQRMSYTSWHLLVQSQKWKHQTPELYVKPV